ncbi:hypothetical protein MYX06_03965, partial [Patescibacteria group bacterium AH-259-L05]|nr:hypothetical protein [Patescibacteria group bacterium AH-259-L05]
MKKLKTVFWLTLIGLVTTPLKTQSHNGWTISIERVYMSMYSDVRIGDIYTFYTTELNIPRKESKPGEYTLAYGTLYDPIILTPHKRTLVWELNSKGKDEKWGGGMRGWEFKNAAYEGDALTQLDTEYNEDGSVTRSIRGIRMFDYMFPRFNKFGDLPIDWWAKNYLHLWIREMYVLRTFSNTLDVRFGIKVAEIFNSHNIGQRHWTTENRNRTFAQTSGIEYMVFGPHLGFDIRMKHAAVLIQQSVLFGTALHTGNWGVIDYRIEDGKETIDPSQKSYGVYNVPLRASTKEVIPATELNLKLNSSYFDPAQSITTAFDALARFSSRFESFSRTLNSVARFSSRFED